MADFWAPKDPSDRLDYYITWQEEMTASSDTIASSSWTVPSGLIKVSDSFTTMITSIWLSGGTDGETYEVKNTITTSGGRIYEKTVNLSVINR